MGYKIYFNSREDLLSFISYTHDFQTWGCRKFYLTCNSGAILTMNTYNGNIEGNGFMQYNNLETYLMPFINTNESIGGIVVDIKLICPQDYKDVVDPDNYYDNFYVNFYSSDSMNYMNLTYEETTNELATKPYIAWVSYIQSFYKKWAIYYGLKV